MDGQQGGSGDRKNMDSVSGWGKAQKGDNSRLRHRRKTGKFDGDRPGAGFKPKSKKNKTLRHVVMKYMHDIKKHIEYCESERKYLKRLLDKYGTMEAVEKKGFWHRRWRMDWHRKDISKLRKKILELGGDPNYLKLKESY